MSYHLDASFRTVDEINYDALGLSNDRNAPDGQANGPRVRTISVDGEDYRISFADDGKASVSFAKTSFFHLFMGSAKTAVREKIQELVDLNSFTKDVSEVIAKTSHFDNVVNTLMGKTGTLAGASEGKFAHYGFSGVRDHGLRGVWHVSSRIGNGEAGMSEGQRNKAPDVKSAINAQLINNYNMGLDLESDTINAAKTITFVRDNNNGTLVLSGSLPDDCSEKDIEDWRNHLKGKDLDLFSKIREARAKASTGATNGWAGEINRQGLDGAVRDMIRKNLDPRFVAKFPDCNLLISGVAKAIIEVSEMDFAALDKNEINERIKDVVSKHVPNGKEKEALKVFNHVAVTAFWRQTSKQGLDFFRARGEPIVFEWTQYDGRKTDGSELQDKWWKNADEDVGDHFGVAITNSEMRHVLKWEGQGFNADGNSVIKVKGGVSQSAAEEQVRRSVDGLRGLPADDIARMTVDLKASFDGMKASDFYGAAEHILRTLPSGGGWVNRQSKLSEDEPAKMSWMRAVDGALGRVRARIEAVKAPAVKAAMLMNVATLFEAELLKDRQLVNNVEMLATGEQNDVVRQSVPAEVACMRRLAGLDRGRGTEVFFSNATGKPNALGSLVLEAAGGNVQNLVDIVSRLKESFAFKLGCQSGEAFGHPAFRSFLVRAASKTYGNVDRLIGKLDIVKQAYEAKLSVKNYLDGMNGLSPETQELYDRRGNWDLDRLVFKEAEKAVRENRPVDFDKLWSEAEGIREICTNAVRFVDEVTMELGDGFQLDDEERRRLADSYLDRENSAVNNYRLNGTSSMNGNYRDAHSVVLAKTKEQIVTLRALSNGALTPRVFKALVINGVMLEAKEDHFKVALAALTEAKKGGSFANVRGRTNAERVENAIRVLAVRVGECVRNACATLGVQDFDNLDTITRLYLDACLAEDSDLKKIFDDAAADPGAMNHIRRLDENTVCDFNGGDAVMVLKHLFSVAKKYGEL